MRWKSVQFIMTITCASLMLGGSRFVDPHILVDWGLGDLLTRLMT